jgi:hypothetical protein
MQRITVDVRQLNSLATVVRALVRFVRRVAFVGLAGAVAIAALLARGGISSIEVVVMIVLLAPPAFLLLFARGIDELVALPQRVSRIPRESQERVSELTRLAGQGRTTSLQGLPLLLWRLRGTVGSLRDVAGIGVRLRMLTPGFLGLALLAAVLCIALAGVGLVALVVVATA